MFTLAFNLVCCLLFFIKWKTTFGNAVLFKSAISSLSSSSTWLLREGKRNQMRVLVRPADSSQEVWLSGSKIRSPLNSSGKTAGPQAGWWQCDIYKVQETLLNFHFSMGCRTLGTYTAQPSAVIPITFLLFLFVLTQLRAFPTSQGGRLLAPVLHD